MADDTPPSWFTQSEKAYDEIHKRLGSRIKDNGLPTNLSLAPIEALYFLYTRCKYRPMQTGLVFMQMHWLKPDTALKRSE